jgi:hypothetical protein
MMFVVDVRPVHRGFAMPSRNVRLVHGHFSLQKLLGEKYT